MAAARSAATAVDFARVYTSLGLGKQTVGALQAFRKRHADAQRVLDGLKNQPTTVDLSKYSGLKNQAIVEEAQRLLANFKPVTYDVSETVKAIDAFQAKAVADAETTVQKVDEELSKLNATLDNIKNARSFEDLTVDEVAQARPEINKAVETMMAKGKWTVPGYTEKFGDLNVA
ncbi:ATP synthase d subunit [Clavulina sp. PMI_390]|nr:ATP synthase d subunit [Clavulina sp. PMI_390]